MVSPELNLSPGAGLLQTTAEARAGTASLREVTRRMLAKRRKSITNLKQKKGVNEVKQENEALPDITGPADEVEQMGACPTRRVPKTHSGLLAIVHWTGGPTNTFHTYR